MKITKNIKTNKNIINNLSDIHNVNAYSTSFGFLNDEKEIYTIKDAEVS